MREDLIKQIDEVTKQNTEYLRDMNVSLNHIRGGICKSTKNAEEEGYDRGLNDDWEIARKTVHLPSNGGYTHKEMVSIFGRTCVNDILERFTAVEVMDRVKKYEEQRKKKEEQEKEAQTFKRGDVVMCHSIIYPPDSRLVVYIGETEHDYDVLYRDHNITQLVSKENYYLTKTDKHIDLDF